MMNNFDLQYQALLIDILQNGTDCSSRGLHYRQKFGVTLSHNLCLGFPLLTLRQLPWGGLVDETIAYLQGSENINEMGRARKFWEYLADDTGFLPHSYGTSWRNWQGKRDQLNEVIDALCYNATSRHHVVQTLDPLKVRDSKCPPCTTGFIFSSDGIFLDLMVNWRSSDLSIGTPTDFAMYALMLEIIASYTQLRPRELMFSIVNAHVYENNFLHAEQMIGLTPFVLPRLNIIGDSNPFKVQFDNIDLQGYSNHGSIKPNFN